MASAGNEGVPPLPSWMYDRRASNAGEEQGLPRMEWRGMLLECASELGWLKRCKHVQPYVHILPVPVPGFKLRGGWKPSTSAVTLTTQTAQTAQSAASSPPPPSPPPPSPTVVVSTGGGGGGGRGGSGGGRGGPGGGLPFPFG